MITRDTNNLLRAKAEKANFLWVNMNNGSILGWSIYIKGGRSKLANTSKVDLGSNIDLMTVEEYEWFTDPNRKTEVVTAADLYDKVEWTAKGFVVDGKTIKTGKAPKM